MTTTEDNEVYRQDLRSAIDFYGLAISKIQDHTGVPTSNLLFELGQRIGRSTGQTMTSNDIHSLIAEVSDLWGKIGMADLKINEAGLLEFTVSKCVNWSQFPNLVPDRCHFHEGVFQGIIEERIGEGWSVVQTNCEPDEGGTLLRTFQIIPGAVKDVGEERC